MTSKLRIDLSHKTERLRFSGTFELSNSNICLLGRKTLMFEADTSQVNYCRGKILHAYRDITGHCGRFGAESDWLNLGASMCRCHA